MAIPAAAGFFPATLAGWAPIVGGGSNLVGGITSALGARGMSQGDLMGLQAQSAWQMHRQHLLDGPTLEIAGLRKAGIHPYLRYGKGGSAMAPWSFSPGMPQPFNRLEGLAQGIGSVGSSAAQSMRDVASAERALAEIPRTKAETDRVIADALRIVSQNELTKAQTATEQERTGQVMQQTLLMAAQTMLNEAQLGVAAAQIGQLGAAATNQLMQAALAEVQAMTEVERQALIRAQEGGQTWRNLLLGNEYTVDRLITGHDVDVFSGASGLVLRWLLHGGQAVGSATGAIGNAVGAGRGLFGTARGGTGGLFGR